MENKTELSFTDSAAGDLERPPEDVKEVYAKMLTEEAQTSNTIKMVEGLLRDGFAKMGLEIGTKIQETYEVPRVVTDTAVVEHYINAAGDRTMDALRVFKHMLASGVEPNAYSYGVIIKALAAAHEAEKSADFAAYVKNYFVEMLERGMQPSEEMYEAVLKGIGRGENKAEVEEFVENVKAKGFVLVLQKEAEERDIPPPLKSKMEWLKEHVMKVFKDATKDCEEEVVQERFREIGKDYESLSNFAFTLKKCLQSIGLVEEANALFKPLPETAICVLPDEAIFIIVIHVYSYGKNKGDVLKAYEHMLACGITPSSCTYQLVIGNLATESKFIGRAKELFLEMLDKGMKPILRTSINFLNSIACLESTENAMEFLEQVKPKGVFPDVDDSCFTETFKTMKLYNDLQKKTTDKDIQEVIRDIHLHGIDKAVAKISFSMVEDGNVVEALELFQPIGQCHINPMVIIYTAAIEAYMNGGKTVDALQTYLDMVANELAPIYYTYSVLIKGLAADPNYFGDAKKYMIEMMDKGMHPNAATYTSV